MKASLKMNATLSRPECWQYRYCHLSTLDWGEYDIVDKFNKCAHFSLNLENISPLSPPNVSIVHSISHTNASLLFATLL